MAELLRARVMLADAYRSSWGRCPISAIALGFGIGKEPVLDAFWCYFDAVCNFIFRQDLGEGGDFEFAWAKV